MNLFTHNCLKIHILVTIYDINMTFSMCVHEVLLEGKWSQVSDVGPTLKIENLC